MGARLTITGANGAVGRRVLRLALDEGLDAIAAVRSASAAEQLAPLRHSRLRIAQIDYAHPRTLQDALAGSESLIHLPGVLIERRDATYEAANIETTRVAVDAARSAGLRSVVLVSVVGADPSSRNRYLRTKGRAEEIVAEAGLGYTILRTGLLLGPGTAGAEALRRQLARPVAWLLGGGRHVQQPLDVDDLARACLRAALGADAGVDRTLELAGPEVLLDRELIERAARIRGVRIRIRTLPIALARTLARLRARLLGPGFSGDVVDVLVRDTRVDVADAATLLDAPLTSLERMLRRSLDTPELA